MKNKLLKLSFGFCLVLVAVLTCGLSSISAAEDDVVLTFSTDELYKMVDDALSYGIGNSETRTITIPKESADKITRIKLMVRDNVALDELVQLNDKLINLTNLSLEIDGTYNYLNKEDYVYKEYDLSFISKFTNLKSLFIAGVQSGCGDGGCGYYDCNIDISPVASLTNLETFTTRNNLASIDLAIFKNMKNLTELQLRKSNILNEDLNQLSGLNNLNTLNFEYSGKIKDISALKNCDKLKTLNITDHEVEDISVLENLKELETFCAVENKIEDINVLQNLPKIEYIEISGNKIKDYSPILNHSNFENIEFEWYPIDLMLKYWYIDNPNEHILTKDFENLENLYRVYIPTHTFVFQKIEDTSSNLTYNLPEIFKQTASGKLDAMLKEGYGGSIYGQLLLELSYKGQPSQTIDVSKGDIKVEGATLSADKTSIVFPADAKDGDVATVAITGGYAYGTQVTVTYKPQAQEDQPVVTPPAEEDEPVVTPPAEEEDKPVVTPPTEDDKEEEELPTDTYEYLAGKNQTYIPGETIGLTFKIDADIALFEKVLVDGKELAENLYTAVSGSTVITLNDEYVKTLAEGKHTLSVQFANNKTSDTEFIIASKKVENEPGDYKENPDTGVVKQSIIISVLALAGIVLCGTVAYKFKRN